jgi:hypothetical protein
MYVFESVRVRQPLNQLANYHEIWQYHHSSNDYRTSELSNSSTSITPTWRFSELRNRNRHWSYLNYDSDILCDAIF